MGKSLVLIRIKVRSAHPAGTARRKRCAGFSRIRTMRYKSPETNGQHCAMTERGEDVKRALRQKGFADQDFKISVEYQRKWGFL